MQMIKAKIKSIMCVGMNYINKINKYKTTRLTWDQQNND